MYTLYTNSMSPYSIKACAMLGYAGFPCQVERQNLVTRYTVLKRLTGKTMVPVLRRGEWAINDSTRIARYAIEHGDRQLVPDDPALGALCWLIEEFADEWVGRWMIHSRWWNEPDERVLAERIGGELTKGAPLVKKPLGRATASMIKEQLGRGGVREANREALEQSRDRTLQGLETYLDERDGYLFGEAPTVADFALYGQLEQYRRDPSGGERMEMYPAIGEWLDQIDRMRLPHPVVAGRAEAAGEFDLEGLEFLVAEFFGAYWRVLLANLAAKASSGDDEGAEEPVATLVDGSEFEFHVSGYVLGRLEFVLELLGRLQEHRDALEGAAGETLREAVERGFAELEATPGGPEIAEGALN